MTDQLDGKELTQAEQDKKAINKEHLTIVGVGTSAGGLEALQSFFNNMPKSNNISFVLVQHLSPDFKSLMVELLSKHTSMKVAEVKNRMKVQAGCVYVIPSKKNMTIKDGKLFLADKEQSQTLNLPIDIFFRSLGEDQKENAIGIILSGTGTDGTRGIRTIKENGGVIIVQEPDSAKFNGMPNSAIGTGLADFILPPNKIPKELINYLQHPTQAGNSYEKTLSRDGDTLSKIMELIRNHTSLDFTYYKRNTIIRRVERRMGINRIKDIDSYLEFLIDNPREVGVLQKEMLIGVTNFFRDEKAFDIMEKTVIPQIFKNKKPDEPIRIWASACSTGEEVYSLAMLFKEYKTKNECRNEVKIFATDIDKEAIEKAGMGNFTESIAADVSPERLKTFFNKKGDFYQVNKQIREMVLFAVHNVFGDPPFNKLDLVVNRNMLIYMESVLQKKILSIFHYALNRDGFMFLGPSETVGELSSSVVSINKTWKIYQVKSDHRPVISSDMLNVPGGPQQKLYLNQKANFPFQREVNQTKLLESLNDILVDEYSPMCAFINESYDVVHLAGGITKYLHLPEKKLSLNILKMLPAPLNVPLVTAIQKALKDNESVTFKNIKISAAASAKMLDLTVKPFIENYTKDKLLLVVLKELDTNAKTGSVSDFNPDEATNERIMYLDQELKATKENLQATIEELETSNEELQASNEELLAANEELQSTNEELQSVNEELHTVNSELQEKIRELTELNDDMTNLLKSTEIGTIFLDGQFNIRKFTPTIKEQFNIIEHDLDRPINHFTNNIGYDKLMEDLRLVLNLQEPIEREIKNKNGKWYLMRIMPYKASIKLIKGVVITFVDISRLKFAEEQLNESDSKYLDLYDNAPAFYVSFDMPSGKLNEMNKTLVQALGYTAKEVEKLTFEDVYMPESVERVKDILKDIEENKKPLRAELTMITKKKNQIEVLVNFSPGPVVKKGLKTIRSVAQDISEKKQHEEKLHQTFNELESTNKRLEEFAYVATHDLRAPAVNLNSLVSIYESLDDNKGKQRGVFEKIAETAVRMNETLEDLIEILEISKKMEHKFKMLTFEEVYQDVEKSVHELIAQKGTEITCDFSKAPKINYSHTHLRSILLNLLTNAVKYSSPDRKSKIEIKTVNTKDFIELSVKDNGVGIDLEKHKDKFFGLFKKLHKGKEGKGVGLYITKSHVESMGGTINVKSELDKGSTFIVTLKNFPKQ